MLVYHYVYSLLNVDVVTLGDGEMLQALDAASNQQVYGTFVYTGHSEIISSDANNVGQFWEPTGTFRLNDIDAGCTVQATGETTWLCASQCDQNVRQTVRPQSVNGSFTLTAGLAFLVLDGTVDADGLTATKFQFFQAREVDLEVTGVAELLLVN